MQTRLLLLLPIYGSNQASQSGSSRVFFSFKKVDVIYVASGLIFPLFLFDYHLMPTVTHLSNCTNHFLLSKPIIWILDVHTIYRKMRLGRSTTVIF